jgi:hypothetical protein
MSTKSRLSAGMARAKAGFQTHVPKPVDADDLAFLIASLIRRLNRDEET